jgi:lipopolysaccharide heptosyltransferase II
MQKQISILIINPFGVGDVLFSTVLVSVIKKNFPRSNIAYICNIRTWNILETNPEVNEIFVFERDEYRKLWRKSKIECVRKLYRFWKEIKRRGFDMTFDLSLGKEYAFLCWLIGIRQRRGFDYKGRGRFLTHKIPFDGFNDKPVAEYYLDLINEVGVREQRKYSTLLVTTAEDDKYIDTFLKNSGITSQDLLVGIAPGGGISFGKKDQEKRRWDADRFAELADRIIKRFNAKIIFIWGPDELAFIEKISLRMKEKALVAPQTSIREMAALCKICSVVICSEGGPLHIASSQGIKTVSIFGPVDEKVYGPYPPGENNVVITSDVGCRPCYKRFKLPKCSSRKCLEDISVDTVFNTFSNLKHTRASLHEL